MWDADTSSGPTSYSQPTFGTICLPFSFWICIRYAGIDKASSPQGLTGKYRLIVRPGESRYDIVIIDVEDYHG